MRANHATTSRRNGAARGTELRSYFADVPVATYEYDGLRRRIEKVVTMHQGFGVVNGSDTGGSVGVQAGQRHEHYFHNGWRLVETTDHAEDVGGEYAYASADVLGQFVYGTQYVDEPLVYDRNLDADADCLEATDARYFYHQDANYRVVMLTDEDAGVVERTRYTAYGEPTVIAGENATGDELGYATPVSAVGNPFLHQGLFHDAETGSYQNRFRQYDAKSGRFMQQDPLGYLDGLSFYTYLASVPLGGVDPAGLVAARPEVTGGLIGPGTPSVWESLACAMCVRKQQKSRLYHRANGLVEKWYSEFCSPRPLQPTRPCKDNGERELQARKPCPNDDDGCKLDAMQHCVGAAMLADRCGAKCAIWAGKLVELKQLDWSRRDLRNNRAGATRCRNATSPVKCCETLLKLGKLDTTPDSDGRCK